VRIDIPPVPGAARILHRWLGGAILGNWPDPAGGKIRDPQVRLLEVGIPLTQHRRLHSRRPSLRVHEAVMRVAIDLRVSD